MASYKKWALVTIAIVVGLLAVSCAGLGAVGLALDGDIDLAITVETSSSPEALFPLVDDVEGITRWWEVVLLEHAQEGTADMQVGPVAGAPTQGVGAQVDFLAGETAFETWTILAIDDPHSVQYDVDFKMMRVTRTLSFTPRDGGASVTWHETGHLANPWLRVMARTMSDESVKENFRIAIEGLDSAARQAPDGSTPAD